ncbi:MAG: sulfatase-like hydrolase/transferase [Bacteroidales bacterium]|nr:sulfatase-like hydrolase/transferase [Bacteroidales bacterium]
MKNQINTYKIKKQHLAYLLFFYPSVVSLALNKVHKIDWYFSDFLENMLFTIIMLGIGALINNRFYKKLYLILLYLLLSSITFIETSYYYLYKSVISSSTIFIFLETNSNEAFEYLANYAQNLRTLILLIIIPACIIIPIIIAINLNHIFKSGVRKTAFMISFSGILLLLMYFFNIIKFNLPYTVVKSYIKYNNETRKYDKLAHNKKGGTFTNVKHNDTGKIIYVLVIGESNTRNHMSLYGYYRLTNPLLTEIKKELLIYEDVISPHANTILSLQEALTLGNYEYPNKRFSGSIFQLLNKAGFTTYWISNQQPIGIYETGITKLSKSCSKRFFVNTRSNRKESTFDEKVLKVLKKVLNETDDKKYIFIQLLGSHVDYKNRYPESFNKFNNIPQSKFKNTMVHQTINEYDNSILYTDYILRQIIETVRSKHNKSYVLYLSDHGEDVFETSIKAYHAEGVKSKYMYDIPFILWRSKTFTQTNSSIKIDTNRKYMTDDLIYSIADLTSLSFDEFNKKRSIFNKNFEPKKRIIMDSLNYDAIF